MVFQMRYVLFPEYEKTGVPESFGSPSEVPLVQNPLKEPSTRSGKHLQRVCLFR